MNSAKQESLELASGRADDVPIHVTANEETDLQDETLAKTEAGDGVPDASASASSASAKTSDEEMAVTSKDKVEAVPCHKKLWNLWCVTFEKYSFLILIAMAVSLAKAYPPLGAKYLAPQITSTWIAVMFIFALSGLGLNSDEFAKAIMHIKFNLYVHFFNFFVDSSVVFGISRLLYKVGAMSIAMADGMTIASCLPLSISMVIALTASSNGDEAAAVFNAAFGNMVGIFLSPVLILMYLGSKGSVDLLDVFVKLTLRVLLPIVVGQLLRKFVPAVRAYADKRKRYFKKFQEWALVYIVYCTFCKTFAGESSTEIPQVLTMLAVLLMTIPLLMVLAWYSLGFFFPDQPKMRVMGLFGATHKTIALGVPLITAMYENSPVLGLYTLPILIWHPMQLFLGSFVAPRLCDYVAREEARLKSNTIG